MHIFLNPGPLYLGPINCPRTSLRNYQYSLRNSLEERISVVAVMFMAINPLKLAMAFLLLDNVSDDVGRYSLRNFQVPSPSSHGYLRKKPFICRRSAVSRSLPTVLVETLVFAVRETNQ
jgi:hypothetical protein